MPSFPGPEAGARDKKGAKIAYSTREEVIVLLNIKEMYISMPKNRILLIVIKCISINKKAIPPLIIILGVLIKEA